MDPQRLNELLQELLNCACDALENGICGEPTVCGCPCRQFIGIGPVVWDREACCDDGQLSVTVDRLYPVDTFPNQSNRVNLCRIPLAADITVTLLRCFPVMDEHGNAPTPDALQTAGEDLHADMLTLTLGLLCCLQARGRSQQFIFQGSRFVGPSGGCAGIELRFVVEL